DFVSLLFQGLMLWLFLPALERWWGMKRFLLFALYTSVAGTVAGTLVGLATGGVFITGLDPFVFAGIVAYGVLYSDRKVQFFGVLPMTGKQLTIGIVGFMVLFVVLQGAWALGAANAAAMGLAWGLTSGRIRPRLWFLKLKQRRVRSKLKVMNGGRARDNKWMN
ncbi:MAG TPA: rhomboid family intramembrane serine protease, partial [Kofleriaceae bacterium]|nr:rhomboid family intramembrane serine protease [Kofleriaceae bacterium]